MKKNILIGAAATFSALFAYLVYIDYLMTNGWRNNLGYCDSLIPRLEEYKNINGSYPKDIELIDTHVNSWLHDYNPNDCGYYSQGDQFRFLVSYGIISSSYYYSESKKWVRE